MTERIKVTDNLITELSKITAPKKWLISCYNVTKNLLNSEIALAQNIKDTTHRKAILKALRSIGDPQPNTAIFASPDHQPVVVEFNYPYSQYRCGRRFFTQPLTQKSSKVFVIMISRSQATIAKVVNSRIRILWRVSHSGVPGKHNQGGQSQGRIMRGIEILVDEHIKRTAEKANEIIGLEETVIVCANLSTNGIFERLRHEKILIGPTPEYQGTAGIHSVIKAMSGELEELEYARELRLIEEFYMLLETDPGRVSYGGHTEQFKDVIRDRVEPKGKYPEAIAFRKMFTEAAILHYAVNG